MTSVFFGVTAAAAADFVALVALLLRAAAGLLSSGRYRDASRLSPCGLSTAARDLPALPAALLELESEDFSALRDVFSAAAALLRGVLFFCLTLSSAMASAAVFLPE